MMNGMTGDRPDKDSYYLSIAATVAARSTCLRRQYGAVIVKDDRVVSTGYNGAARGYDNCCDLVKCRREEMGVPHGERYELCRAVHAEANAIINACPGDMVGATLYLAGIEHGKRMVKPCPCDMCDRLIRNAQIARVVVCSE